MQLEGTFTLSSWVEKTWDGQDWRTAPLPRCTLAEVVRQYEGDLVGSSTARVVLSYKTDDLATFVGLEYLTVSIGGRSGTFVLRHIGTFDERGLHVKHDVVAGSGTGELVGLRGEGEANYGHLDRYPFTLTYQFE